MRAIIIDDEEQQRSLINKLIKRYAPAIQVVGEAASVSRGSELIKEEEPDLVFLDVELTDGTGFDLLQQVAGTGFHLIFITAHNEFAIRAFRFSALDYLLKPIDPEEFAESVQKAMQLHQKQQMEVQLAVLMGNIQSLGDNKKLVLRDASHIHVVQVADICYLQSENNYTSFILADKRKIVVTKALKEYEQLLANQRFFRSHQSYLINLAYLRHIDKRDGGSVVMKDGTELPLATRKREALIRLLEEL